MSALPDWDKVLDHLSDYPPGIHRLLPPCSKERLSQVQSELGQMPAGLVAMLTRFNGGKLFCLSGGSPTYSLFGVSVVPPLPRIEWSRHWWIDRFTRSWRESHEAETAWVIGLSCDGRVAVLDQIEIVRTWDSAVRWWDERIMTYSEWIWDIIKEGEICMEEARRDGKIN